MLRSCPQWRTRRRPGFTFIEVLFAVILLGIGFILVAAVFPVAIQQGQASIQETAGTLICRDAVRIIEGVATKANFPTVGTTITPFGATENAAIGGNAFFSGDHRYGWAGYYRRANVNDPFMQVWVVALQNSSFINTNNPSNAPPNVPPIIPAAATANFVYDSASGTEYVDISNSASAVEGAYVLVANDSGGGVSAPANGRVFRLGNELSTNRYQLAPGYDMLLGANNVPSEATTSPISVYIIGRAPDPLNSGNFAGANQDLIVETSFVRLTN